ncbi:MAG: hypothetical protein O9262_06820 [Cyclobacteriaceae bacterium]|nr:hypothetical protein [Cyclobacteriaceae bacterium]
MKNIISAFLSVAILLGVMMGCEDEVIVRVEDTKSADSLIALITNVSNQYLALDQQNGTLEIINTKLERALDSLLNVRDNINDPYSRPQEIHFTLNVLSSANTIFTGGSNDRSQGVTGATVTLEQNGLVVSADASSKNGLYLFKGLREGNAFVTVTAPDHTPVEFTVYVYKADGEDVSDATSYNASTQVVLYPNAGTAAGKITGKAYANLSTLNDTIGYKFGSIAAFGAKANTYIASPGLWRFYNYTQYQENQIAATIYSTFADGMNIQWENALAGHKIYAIPFFNNTQINDESQNGYITNITYKNVITSATIAADGSYTLPVLSGNTYNVYQLFSGFRLTTEEMVTDHTRLTDFDGAFYGQENETGSTDQSFTFYNRTNGSVNVYTGTGVTQTAVPSAGKLTITRKKITEKYGYEMFFPNESQGSADDKEVYYWESYNAYPQAGETKVRNIYFFPYYKR